MANIPIFIPHVGCKNDCVFCNQKSITGKTQAPTFEKTDEIIKENLSTLSGTEHTIAFFGGSFTGIGDELMEGYLKVAHKYVETGKVKGIRLSTRPDYITEKILDILEKYCVTNVELGAQSLDDEVLKAANRGHSAKDVEKASEMILNRGMTLGLQMMIGLPCDTKDKSIETAKKIVCSGAKETRIYPTVVIKDTQLARMYVSGEYVPMSFEEAIDTAAEAYRIFFENGIKILRIGLQNSLELKESVVGGFYHDALGEKVYSRVIRQSIKQGDTVTYNKRFFSKVAGQKKENLDYLKENNIACKLEEDNIIEGVMVNGKYVLTF